MTKEEIAIELTKAWSMQPSTAVRCWEFDKVMENYKTALEELSEVEEKREGLLQNRIDRSLEILDTISQFTWDRDHYIYTELNRIRAVLRGDLDD